MKRLMWLPCIALLALSLTAHASSLSDVANNLFGTVLNIREIIRMICMITGGAMVLSSFFRYRIHRRNPIEAPISSVVLLFIAGLCVFGLAYIPILVDA